MSETPQGRGYAFEADWAARFGVEPKRGSGSLWYAKMDAGEAGTILWSCKHTDAESFRLSKGLMQEVVEAITGQGGIGGDTIPGIAVEVGGEIYCTLRAEDLLRILTEEIRFISPSKGELKRARASVPALLRDSEDDQQ